LQDSKMAHRYTLRQYLLFYTYTYYLLLYFCKEIDREMKGALISRGIKVSKRTSKKLWGELTQSLAPHTSSVRYLFNCVRVRKILQILCKNVVQALPTRVHENIFWIKPVLTISIPSRLFPPELFFITLY
jgi:hypothetical protein